MRKSRVALVGLAGAFALFGAWGCGGGESPESAAPAAEAEAEMPEEAPRVEAADIDAALANGALLLDVRTDQELAEHGTIEGFVHIPIDELEARLGELPQGVPILTA